MRRILFASVLTVLLAAVGANAGTLKQVRLAEYGHNARNTIHSPIFRAGSAPLTVGKFTSAKDFNTKIVRGLGNLFTKGPTYDLDRKVNVADLVAESLRAEAKAMALSFVAPDGTEPWDITGDLRNTYIECWQITGWGAILFYGYMDVALQIRRPDGTSLQQRFRVHTFSETPGAASFGRGGKAEVAIATMLVEGAQEILARLNHDVLKAEPAPQIQSVLQRLGLEGASGHENELRFVGLSGGPAAAATLLKLLRTEEDDDIRYLVIDAIACTGSLDARVALIDRYGGEDESGRWYSIKALDYIGGENASSFITDKGPRDAADSVKRLAARILGG